MTGTLLPPHNPARSATDHHLGRHTARGLLKSQVVGRDEAFTVPLRITVQLQRRWADCGLDPPVAHPQLWPGPHLRSVEQNRDALCCPHAPVLSPGPPTTWSFLSSS